MEQFFSERSYYEFPSIEAAIFALLLSFFLATVIALTYRLTFRGLNYSKDLFQAIVLISIIAAMIMMAIGDSLARGLGILGALAIIRFRFRFSNPKNIVYIFASLAVGISSGVHGFSIAVAGTGVFTLISFLLYLSPFGKADFYDVNLSFILSEKENIEGIEKLLDQFCNAVRLMDMREIKGAERYEYRVNIKKDTDRKEFFRILNSKDYITDVRMNSRGSVDRV